MRLLSVMNPTSGKTSNDEAALYLEEVCEEKGVDLRVIHTTGNDDDTLIKNEIKSLAPDRVAACGGDGTVQLVARNLIDSNIPMGILPLGSANGLATAIGLPKNLPGLPFLGYVHQDFVPTSACVQRNDHHAGFCG